MSGNTISHYRIVEKLASVEWARFRTKAVPPFHRETRDGKELVPAKGENRSDVVLIRNFS